MKVKVPQDKSQGLGETQPAIAQLNLQKNSDFPYPLQILDNFSAVLFTVLYSTNFHVTPSARNVIKRLFYCSVIKKKMNTDGTDRISW